MYSESKEPFVIPARWKELAKEGSLEEALKYLKTDLKEGMYDTGLLYKIKSKCDSGSLHSTEMLVKEGNVPDYVLLEIIEQTQ